MWCDVLDELVGPRDEVFPIRSVGMAAVVLPPGKLTVEQAHVDVRHFLDSVIVRTAEVLRAEQSEHGLRGDGRHEATLMVEPPRVALFGYTVADECRPWRAERDQFMCVNRKIAAVPATEARLDRAILQEVAGHPVVLATAGEVLDGLAPIPAMKFCSALSG